MPCICGNLPISSTSAMTRSVTSTRFEPVVLLIGDTDCIFLVEMSDRSCDPAFAVRHRRYHAAGVRLSLMERSRICSTDWNSPRGRTLRRWSPGRNLPGTDRKVTALQQVSAATRYPRRVAASRSGCSKDSNFARVNALQKDAVIRPRFAPADASGAGQA